MFDVLHIDTLPATRWKNGGGVTREIARTEQAGAIVWRISVADVARDGPFSHFAGLMRCLTVIHGAGIDLQSPHGTMRARPGAPVRFSGDMPVNGCLIDGPIRDLNVIFDPSRIRADVVRICGKGPIGPIPAGVGTDLTGVLVLAGDITVDRVTLPPGTFALGTIGTVDPGADGEGLIVTLRSLA